MTSASIEMVYIILNTINNPDSRLVLRYIKGLKESLEEITKGKGAYSMNRLEHANNTIESMKQIAKDALGEPK